MKSKNKDSKITEQDKPLAPADGSPRFSNYGFYCSDCNKFVHKGYDTRDKIGLPNNCAVCVNCGDNYIFK